MAQILLALSGRKGRQTMEDQQPLPLVAGESVTGELYVSTRDVRIRGFQWVGTGLEGKLVLTNYRLFYCFYDQRSVAFALEPWDVSSVELQPVSFFSVRPRMVIMARLAGDTAPRRLTFTVPKSATVTLGAYRHLVYANPSTPEDFHDWLQQWIAGGGAPDGATRGHILAQRRELFEASLAGDVRRAIVRLSVAWPLALCVQIAPIFGFLALRDARRLGARAAAEQVSLPRRAAWISRLGIAWIAVGGFLWGLLLFAMVFGPIVKE